MADRATTIVIKGKVAYDDEITVTQAARIIAFLNTTEGEDPTLETPLLDDARDTRHSGKKVESAREALDRSGAKTNPEKIVALSAYVLQDGGDTFKVEDVKTQFRRARETAPGNFTRDLAVAVQAGWLAEGGGNEYYITNKIQDIFDGGFKFPKPGNATKSRSTSRGAKPKTAAKPEVFADMDEFSTSMEGFQPYSKMKQNKTKLLWVVKFAKDNGVKGLANKDVAWLTDHLGDGIPSRQITASFNSAKSSGFANRSTQDNTIRITPDGETYLATVGVPASGSQSS